MKFAAVVAQAAFLFQYQDCTNYLSNAFSSPNVASRPGSSSSNSQHNIIFSDIHSNDNASFNSNAAVGGLGRRMSKNDNIDEDNVEDLHDINKKKGISPAAMLGASTVITTQLYATKALAVGTLLSAGTIGEVNMQDAQRYAVSDSSLVPSSLVINSEQSTLETTPSSQISSLLLAEETTATKVDEELSALLEQINIDSVQKVREQARKEVESTNENPYQQMEEKAIKDAMVAAREKELENERVAAEKRLQEQERIDKIAAEKEAERLAAVEEQERIDKAEAKRVEQEKAAEAEADRLEQDRIEAEQVEQERLDKAEAERVEQERLANIEAERLEQERLDKIEADRIEQERIEAERVEQERIDKIEAERLEQERIAEKMEEERLAKIEAERVEQERLEKIEAERVEQERVAKEEAEKAEKIRLEKLAEEEATRIAEENARIEAAKLAEQEKEKEIVRIEKVLERLEVEEQSRILAIEKIESQKEEVLARLDAEINARSDSISKINEQVDRLTREADEAKTVLERLREAEDSRELEKSKAIDARKAIDAKIDAMKSKLSDIQINSTPLQESLKGYQSKEALYKLRPKIPEGFSVDVNNLSPDGEQLENVKKSLEAAKSKLTSFNGDLDDTEIIVAATAVATGSVAVAAALPLFNNEDDDDENKPSSFNVNGDNSPFGQSGPQSTLNSSEGQTGNMMGQSSSMPSQQGSSFEAPTTLNGSTGTPQSSFGNNGSTSDTSKSAFVSGSSFNTPPTTLKGSLSSQSAFGSNPSFNTPPTFGSSSGFNNTPPSSLKGSVSKGAGSGFTKGNTAASFGGKSSSAFGSNGGNSAFGDTQTTSLPPLKGSSGPGFTGMPQKGDSTKKTFGKSSFKMSAEDDDKSAGFPPNKGTTYKF